MRVLWVVLFCLLLFFGLAIAAQFYLQDSARKINMLLEPVDSYINQKQWTAAGENLHKVSRKWEKNRFIWGLIVDHWEIDNIDVAIRRLNKYIQTKSRVDALAEFATLKQAVNHIPEKETLSWESIF